MSEILNLCNREINGYGSKADNLSIINNHGLLIPNGVVLSSKRINNSKLDEALSGLIYPLIIRTSTNIEDTSDQSLAGVFKSTKVNKKSEINNAIQQLVLWTKKPDVLDLLEILNVDRDTFEINIIIQEYVVGNNGGVIFTNPSTNTFEVEIAKNSTIVTDGLENLETHTLPIGGQIDSNKKILLQLQENIQKISTIFEGPLDIEWIEDNNQIYILQVRPIVSSVDSSSIVTAEIERLTKNYNAHGLYDNSVLPDLQSPATVSISLLEKIYSNFGPFSNYRDSKITPADKINDTYIATIFGRPYLDTEKINRIHLAGSFKKYKNNNSKIVYGFKITGVLGVFMHPYQAWKYFTGNLFNLFKLKTYVNSSIVQPPNDSMGFEFLCNYLLKDLCIDIFQTSNYIQFIDKQIKIRVPKKSDFLEITQDKSTAPWMIKDEFDPVRDAWHLSYDENEIASKSIISDRGGIEDIKKMYYENQKNISKSNSNKILDKVISNWDKTLLSNQIVLLNKLHQRRANLHDNYIKTIRLMHNRLEIMQNEMKIKNIWYSTIDEIINNNIPFQSILSERKRNLNIIQKQFIQPVNSVNNWKNLIINDNSFNYDTNIEILSPGSFRGNAVNSISRLSKENSILITKSLSQEIIYNHDKLSGVITEIGSRLSHIAILAREVGLPVIKVDSVAGYENAVLEVRQSLDKTEIIIL